MARASESESEGASAGENPVGSDETQARHGTAQLNEEVCGIVLPVECEECETYLCLVPESGASIARLEGTSDPGTAQGHRRI